MKDSIKIDSEKLNEYVIKLKEDEKKVLQIFDNIKSVTRELPNYWQSETCSNTMAIFEKLYKDFDNINESNKKYISFLDAIVAVDYSNKDDSLNKIIDNNI